MLSRRGLLRGAAAVAAGVALPPGGPRAVRAQVPTGAAAMDEIVLEAAPGGVQLADDGGPPLPVWAYNGRTPGPVLRLNVGDVARIRLRNRLEQPTTVHWHGMRVPNAMDGVPGISQDPVLPGAEFRYEFPVRHPGTFWYHPHFQSAEQLDRGLAGAIVVAEREPPAVDRDLVLVLDDWRLDRAGNVHESFGDLHDASHAGRLGNVPSVNGRIAGPLRVRAGERLRLRLLNAANARVFALRFAGHSPTVIALDGHAVTPHVPRDGRVVLGPAMRVDLIVDCSAAPGSVHDISDSAYPRRPFRLTEIRYEDAQPLAGSRPDVAALPPPPFPEPDLARAEHHELVLEGGAMGGLREGELAGKRLGIRELARRGKVWALNGIVAPGHGVRPWLRAALGSSHVITVHNRTAFPHPMHLHGHPLRVLAHDGEAMPYPVWRDTLLVSPREQVRFAFVADNPGRWLIHCHIPEHMEAGMLGVVEVG